MGATNGFKFDTDQALEHLRANDRRLAKLLDRVGPFELKIQSLQSPFVSLLQAIVYQQLSKKAAATIHGRLLAKLPPKNEEQPAAILALPEDDLRACGMSRAKVLAAKDLAQKTLDGLVPTLPQLRKLSDDEIITRLTAIRGIGRWTVEMMLIFRLGRPDILPLDDLGIRRGFYLTFGGDASPSKQALIERGKKWQPFRSVASWYLWRAVDAERESKQAQA